MSAAQSYPNDVAGIDDLTGAWNRAGFIAAATPMLASCQRRNASVTLAYFDFGHESDDAAPSGADADAITRALSTWANELRRSYRTSDLIGRVGPTRVALLLTDQTDLSMPITEGVQTVAPATEGTSALTLTVGIAHGTPDTNLLDLMDAADRRMTQLVGANDATRRWANEAAPQVPAKRSRFRTKNR